MVGGRLSWRGPGWAVALLSLVAFSRVSAPGAVGACLGWAAGGWSVESVAAIVRLFVADAIVTVDGVVIFEVAGGTAAAVLSPVLFALAAVESQLDVGGASAAVAPVAVAVVAPPVAVVPPLVVVARVAAVAAPLVVGSWARLRVVEVPNGVAPRLVATAAAAVAAAAAAAAAAAGAACAAALGVGVALG